jgi:IS5 family transposase
MTVGFVIRYGGVQLREDGMRRDLGQLSLADGLVEGAGRNRQLEKIAALVDWAAFARLLGEVYAAPVGRPSYRPLVLLRCLLLQQWYGLSDPGLEEALSDRLSFRRFAGLALADPVPDHSTLSRFRSELVRRGLSEPLLAELNRQLDARGLMVKSGTLIDASLVAADGRRPRKGEPVEGRSGQARAEIARVLTPGGIAILPVPIVAHETIEHPEPVPAECNHVRAPGLDYFDRYREHFGRVEVYRSSDFAEHFQTWTWEDRTTRTPRTRTASLCWASGISTPCRCA